MAQGLRSDLRRLALLFAATGLGALASGHALWWFAGALALWCAHGLWRARQVDAWLAGGEEALPPELAGAVGQLVDELHRTRRRLDQAKRNFTALALRIRQITTALEDGLILLGADRTLDWWNPAATQMLGLTEEDRGEVITNLVRDPAFVRFIQAGAFDRPLELRSPRDPERIFLFSAATFGRGELVLTIRDISRLRRLETLRRDLVANVSHELRTPLTVLLGYLETLAGDAAALPPQYRRAIVQMEEQARRLSSLAEDLATLARLESAPPAGPVETIPLREILAGIAEDLRAVSERHPVVVDCPEGLVLRGETKAIRSAFSNLAFNALRHNPQGCRIWLRARRSPEALVVEVIDDGVGIDPKHLPRLTERFYRADESRASTTGGSGLGLAIAKHALLRHGGSLEIESTPGKGATFRCRFPAPA